MKHGVPLELILGPLLFILYINYLPKVTNNKSKIVLSADDTRIIITDINPLAFISEINGYLKT